MKYLVIALCFFSCCGTKPSNDNSVANADSTAVVNTAAPAAQTGKAVALYFGSMASGPIGDEFLKTWLQNFIKNEKVNITADKYSACGKEGEYIIVIYKNDFTVAKDSRFTSQLKNVLDTEVKRAKAENPSSGSVEIRPDPKTEDYDYCRLGSQKWL